MLIYNHNEVKTYFADEKGKDVVCASISVIAQVVAYSDFYLPIDVTINPY